MMSKIIDIFTNLWEQQIVHFKVISKRFNFWLILLLDIVVLHMAHLLGYFLRFDLSFQGLTIFYLLTIFPLLLLVKIPVFYLFGLYSGMWRYTSIRDINNIGRAVFISSAILIVLILYFNRFQGFSRSVFVLDAFFSFLFISGIRVTIRTLTNNNIKRFFTPDLKKDKLLLIGAGDAAEKIVREIRDNKQLPYTVVGFVDDDKKKVGRQIHGIPVLGSVSEVSTYAAITKADEILIAIASATGKQMKRLVRLCKDSGMPFKVLPGLGEIIDGKVSVKAMRNIAYKDLLGRDEVQLEQRLIGSFISGKTILVTGAGGSIGSELCRQLIRFKPKTLILFDAGEENLYSIQMELEHEFEYHNYFNVLGNLQREDLVTTTLEKFRPQVVFHAAAYKHVPLIEENPWEAVLNNINATQILMKACLANDVERFVLVSTDKAVRPMNIMGASKRVTELMMLAYGNNPVGHHSDDADNSDKSTIFQAVRFGNVIGSSGSVIPLFKRQIETGGPVTVTHPEVTRYFMSIEEAAQLIIQAGAMGTGDEIFILQMGMPIKIDKIARELISLAGKKPDIEIEIKYIGLRAGEKLYEELITEGEGIVNTDHKKIMVLRSENIDAKSTFETIDKLIEKAKDQEKEPIIKLLLELVPEFTPEQTEQEKNRQIEMASV